jgi:predicted outer membrane repeat protein
MSSPTVRPFIPSLFQLERRDTPEIYPVYQLAWNATVENSLPWAVAQANANPGYDEIHIVVSPPPPPGGPPQPPTLDNPTFGSTATLEITEEVFIRGSTLATQTVTITGVRPFRFTHTAPKTGIFGQELPHESMVGGIIFDNCTADMGGAIRIDTDNLTAVSCQFLENKATQHGGAIYVGPNATLTVDGNYMGWYPPVKDGPRCFFEKNEAAQDGGAIDGGGNLFL